MYTDGKLAELKGKYGLGKTIIESETNPGA